MTASIGRFVNRAGAVVALLSFAAAAEGQSERPGLWTAAVGMNILSASLGSGSGYQAEVRRHAFDVDDMYSVDFALSGTFGSARHTPLRCELARRFYCFGGSESVKTAGAGLSIQRNNAARVLGFDLAPRVLLGMAVVQVLNEELEGPTGICIAGGELVACPDNPPFKSMSARTTNMMPAMGYGLTLAKSYGKLVVALDLTAYGMGQTFQDHQRVGAGVQFQFVR